MKKRLLLLLLLIGTFPTMIFGQKSYPTTYEAEYTVKFRPDSTHRENQLQEKMYLYTGKDYGVFLNYPTAKDEEIRAELQRQIERTGSINIPKEYNSKFKKSFYKDLEKKNVRAVSNIYNQKFVFEEPAPPFSWEIQDSTKTIGTYTAQKATTHFAGRDYVAWFTPEIPLQDGPYIFFGLPGLIVDLYDVEYDYHFSLQSLKKLEEEKVWKISNKAKETTKAKFIQLKAQAPKIDPEMLSRIDNGMVMMQDSDGKKLSKAEIKRRFRKKNSGPNNPIELKE